MQIHLWIACLGLFLSVGTLGACNRTQTESQVPQDPQTVALVQRAQMALAEGDYTQAQNLAGQALDSSPLSADAHFIQGRIFFDLNQLDSAEVAYQKVAQLDPTYPGVWHNLANVSFRQRQYREAKFRFTQELDYNEAPNSWHGLGGAHEALGETDSARMAYTRAVDLDVSYAPAASSLSDLLEREGDFRNALVYARSALAGDSSNTTFMFQVGSLLNRTGDHEAAIPILEKLTDREPWNYAAWNSLGQAVQRSGDNARGARILEHAATVREEQAIVDRLERTAESQPTNFAAQIQYAEALRRTNRLEDAIRAYLVAEQLRPDNLALQNNVATLFLQSGNTAEATRRYERITRVDSTFGEAWINLAILHSQNGDSVKANTAIRNAMRFAPDHPFIKNFTSREAQ